MRFLCKEFGFNFTILNLDERAAYNLSNIRKIEALLLDEVAAAKLLKPSAVSNVLSFKSVDGVDECEQYGHLSQLLHIQKATKDKR